MNFFNKIKCFFGGICKCLDKQNEKSYDLSHLTVEELKFNKWDVEINHYRFSEKDYQVACKKRGMERNYRLNDMHYFRTGKITIEPRGGKTTVYLTDPNGDEYIGESICSTEDGFNRKIGVKTALKKLVKII